MRTAPGIGAAPAAILAALVAVATAASPAFGEPFKVPPLDARVVDTGNRLTATERNEIDQTLAGFRQRTGIPIVIFIPDSLAGHSIEDVAYETFNTWKLGDKGKDNGLLVVIAPDEKRVRLEVGNGLGGAITDLQSNDIIRNKMAPLLAAGQLKPAVEAAFIAIQAAIDSDPTITPRPTGSGSIGWTESQGAPRRTGGGDWTRYLVYGAIALVVIVLLARGRRGGRGGGGGRGRGIGSALGGGIGGALGGGWFGGRGGGGGGFFGGRGGGGNTDFGGGGGRSGGGGSSDSY